MSTTKQVMVTLSSYFAKHSIPFVLGIFASILISSELAILIAFSLIVYNFFFVKIKEVIN